VRDHAPDEILRIVEARAAVEGAAARLAAARIAGDDIERLVHIVDAIDQPETTRPRLNELNKAFHGIITAASGNFLLVQFAQRTNISYWAFSMTTCCPRRTVQRPTPNTGRSSPPSPRVTG